MRQRDRQDRVAHLREREHQDEQRHQRRNGPPPPRAPEALLVENAAIRCLGTAPAEPPRATGPTRRRWPGAASRPAATRTGTSASPIHRARRDSGQPPPFARAVPRASSAFLTSAGVRARGHERGEGPEPRRPATHLSTPRGERFDEQIGQQPQQASGVADGVEKVRGFGFGIVCLREPVLQERGRGREREEREADGAGQRSKHPPPWISPARLSDLNRHRQHDARDDQHADMDRPLPPSRHACAQRVGVEDIPATARLGKRRGRYSRPPGLPPRTGSRIFASRGCTMKSSVAEKKIASAKSRVN